MIVEQHVTQHPNDKQQIEPALQNLAALPEQLGEVDTLLADTGYYSEANVRQCNDVNIEPLIPEKRQKHNLPLQERLKKTRNLPNNPNLAFSRVQLHIIRHNP